MDFTRWTIPPVLLALLAVLAGTTTAATPTPGPAVPPAEPVERALAYLADLRDAEGCIAPGGHPSPTLTDWAAMAFAAGENEFGPAEPSLADGLRACEPQQPEDDGSGFRPNWVAALARHALAVEAAGGDAREFNGTAWVAELRSYHDGTQFRDPNHPHVINDDAFAVMALRAVGVPADDGDVQASARTIRNAQNGDGGWSYVPSGPSDTDDTAAMLEALRAADAVDPGDLVVQRALDYLASNAAVENTGCFQHNDGFDGANVDSTTWATLGLLTVHQDPRAPPWGDDGGPWGCLLDRQLDSGAFPASTSTVANEYTTTQAVLALTGVPHGRAAPRLDRPSPTVDVDPEPVVGTTTELRAEGAAFASWQTPDGAVTNASATRFAPETDGPRTYELLALAGDGVANRRTLNLVVASPEPRAPLVVSPTQPTDGAPATFRDESRDPNPDGGIVERRLAPGDGTAIQAADPVTEHTYPDEGDYIACLEVEDEQGLANETCRTVPVANAPPQVWIEAPEEVPHVNETVTLGADAGDPSVGGGIAGYAWELGDGTTASTPTVDHAYNEAGTYNVTVEVADDDGAQARDELALPVGNLAPELGPVPRDTVLANRTLTFELDAGDPNGDPLAYDARGLPGGARLTDQGTFTWTPSPGQEGDHAVAFTASDAEHTAGLEAPLHVAPNRPPAIDVRAPDRVEAGELVRLAADARDPDGSAGTRLAWDFDRDGSPDARGARVRHAFPEVGERAVAVHAWDADGIHALREETILVDDALRLDAHLFNADDGFAPHERPTLAVLLQRHDATPLVGTPVTATVEHLATGRVLSEATAVTGPDGLAHLRLPYDLGDEAGLNLPGRHRVQLEAQAASQPGAPVPDTEHAATHRTYRVTP